jgi:hypothetical protein
MTDNRKDEMPDEIYADTDDNGANFWDTHLKYGVRYVRADIVNRMQDALNMARIELQHERRRWAGENK